MSFLRLFPAAVLLIVTACAGRAATVPPAKPKPAVHASDADIEKAIRAKFAKSKIGTEKYSVHVQGGVATITGHTDVVQHKGTATRLAKTGGALAVVNNVQISQAAKDKAMQNLEKGRRRAQIKRTETVARSQTSR